MKLASLKGGRDGRLVVVSDDLAWCADASHVAPTLQAALDDWERAAPRLANLATDLAHEAIPMMRFHERHAASPLPRAYRWTIASAYGDQADPRARQGVSDGFIGPRDPIPLIDAASGCDFGAGLAVVVGDVAQGATRAQALAAIRLVGLANALSSRDLDPAEPTAAFSPVFMTPESLGDRWREGKLHGALQVDLNGQPFGRARAEIDMTFDFGALIAHLAGTRGLVAGSIIGSGAVSNRGAGGGPARPAKDGGTGYCCIAERRMAETIATGEPATPFLRGGDRVAVTMLDDQHHPIFGTIEQEVAAAA